MKDHFISGIGLNKFSLVYRIYQAKYFKEGNYTVKELLLADNTQHAFNDYLKFAIELGITGFIMLLLIVGFIAYLIKKAIKNNAASPIFLMFAISQINAIAIAAIFTHVFEQFIFQSLFLVSFFIVLYYAFYPLCKIINVVLCTFSIIYLGYLHFGYYLKNYKKYDELKQANNLFRRDI